MLVESPASVLVVDSSQLVRELVRDSLLEAGYAVETTGDGQDALERAARRRPDLVISEVLMPGMDGWALCEALKSDPHTRDLPLIFLSAAREVPHRLRGLRLGAYDYRSKPFAPEELGLRVSVVLERLRTGSAHGEAPRSFLSGHTSHLPIADLMQLLAMNGKTGCLRLRAAEQGRIHFREGRIVGAFTARANGRKALFRMLGWAESDFHFDPVDDPTVTDEFEGNTQRLLMDALVELDDLRRLAAELPEHDELLTTAEGARDLLEDPALITPLEVELLDLARGGTCLEQMLDRMVVTDLEIARAVSHLISVGALERG